MRIENPPRDLPTMIARRFEWSMGVPEVFFAREEQRIALAGQAMARRFQQGGRLLVFAQGSGRAAAEQIAATFMQPCASENQAFPALVLHDESFSFAAQLRLLGRGQDIACGLTRTTQNSQVTVALAEARKLGLLTLGLSGSEEEGWPEPEPDFLFAVSTHDPLVIQETHAMLSNILWELVQSCEL